MTSPVFSPARSAGAPAFSDEAGAALTCQPCTRLFGGEILQFNADVAKFLSGYRGRGEERESDKQMNGGPTVQRHGYLARC
jgi:hypothetical protein